MTEYLPAPQSYLDSLNRHGLVDQRYLRHFANRMTQALITKNKAEIMTLGEMIAEATARYKMPNGKLSKAYWEQWPDGNAYEDVDDWCWRVLHFRKAKAYALRRIYLHLTAMNLSEHTLTRALRLGWSKLVNIVSVARSEVTLLQWIDRAETHDLTEQDIRTEVQLAKGTAKTREAGDAVSTAAEGFDDDEDDSGPPPKRKPQVRVTMIFDGDKAGREDLRLWRAALKKVKRRVDKSDMGDAKAAALMATHYMSSVPDAAEGGVTLEVEFLCQAIEAKYGVAIGVFGEAGLLPQVREVLEYYRDDESVAPLLEKIDYALRAGEAPPPADT